LRGYGRPPPPHHAELIGSRGRQAGRFGKLFESIRVSEHGALEAQAAIFFFELVQAAGLGGQLVAEAHGLVASRHVRQAQGRGCGGDQQQQRQS
jgi:hypothetical protein